MSKHCSCAASALKCWQTIRLLEANLHNDMTMVAEVADLLETVKSGWDAIEPGH